MTVLFFAGSLRTESFNKKHAREAMRLAGEKGIKGEFIDLRDYAMPVYDEDIQDNEGFPDTVTKLAEKISAATALVISTPEYNGSIPGGLKNVIDWLSRLKPMPLADKSLLLLAASPGPLSGVRGLWHSRVPFEAVGVHVYPTMIGLAKAHEAFDEAGKLKDEKTTANLQATLEKFIAHVAK